MKLSTLTVALLAVVSLASTANLVRAADLDWANARQVFTNDKGQYRPDWAAGINRPAYIDGRVTSLQNRTDPAVAKAAPAKDDQKAPYALTGQPKDTPAAPQAVRHYNDKGRLMQ